MGSGGPTIIVAGRTENGPSNEGQKKDMSAEIRACFVQNTNFSDSSASAFALLSGSSIEEARDTVTTVLPPMTEVKVDTIKIAAHAAVQNVDPCKTRLSIARRTWRPSIPWSLMARPRRRPCRL